MKKYKHDIFTTIYITILGITVAPVCISCLAILPILFEDFTFNDILLIIGVIIIFGFMALYSVYCFIVAIDINTTNCSYIILNNKKIILKRKLSGEITLDHKDIDKVLIKYGIVTNWFYICKVIINTHNGEVYTVTIDDSYYRDFKRNLPKNLNISSSSNFFYEPWGQ